MSLAKSAPSSLSTQWGQVLVQVNHAVSQALAALDAREQILAQENAGREGSSASALKPPLDAVKVKLLGLEERTGRIAALVRETDRHLAECEEEMRRWVDRTRKLPPTLADSTLKG